MVTAMQHIQRAAAFISYHIDAGHLAKPRGESQNVFMVRNG